MEGYIEWINSQLWILNQSEKMANELWTGTELKPLAMGPSGWLLSAPFIFAVVIGSFLAGAGCACWFIWVFLQ